MIYLYIQNCLQQDFCINIDHHGDIGVQVHNPTWFPMVSSQQEKGREGTLRAPWVLLFQQVDEGTEEG